MVYRNPGSCLRRPGYAGGMKALAATTLSLGLLAALPGSADAAFHPCRPILDVGFLDGTRYEGSDIYRIRAQAVGCRKARRVARGATRKALGLTPPASGVKRFRYGSWSVVDDLRGDTDRYVARIGDTQRIKGLFGDA